MPRRAVVASLLAVIAAGVVVLLLRLLPHTAASGDGAVTEIYLLHTLRGPWLLGPYSQFYWNHPGPLLFYLLAPLYGLSGERALALGLGAALINAGAVAGIVGVLRRGTGPAATAVVAGAMAIWGVRCAPMLVSYWNPEIIALPAALFVALSAHAAGGSAAALAGVAFAGAFLAQSHIGLLAPVGALTAAAAAMGWWNARRADESRRGYARGCLAVAALAAALWTAPVVEELTGHPGNLTTVARYFEQTTPPPRPLLESASVWAAALAGVAAPDFTTPVGVPAPRHPRPWLVGVVTGGVALLGVRAWQTRERPGLSRTALFCAMAAGVALPAIHRSPALVGDYTVFWLSAVGAMAAAVLACWPIANLARGAMIRALPALTMLTIVGLAGHRFALHVRAAAHTTIQPATVLDRDIDDALHRRAISDPIVFIADDVWADAAGALLQRYKRREPFSVDPAWQFMYGRPLVDARCHTHTLSFDDAGRTGPGDVVARAGRTIVRLEARQTCPEAN